MPNIHTVPEMQSPVHTPEQPDFVLHGIDYLPESEKRKERRQRQKSTVPRFLRIDTTLWSSSYLRFLNRINRSSPTPGVERPCTDAYPTVTVAASDCDVELLENRTEHVPMQPVAVETPDCFEEIVSDEWTKYSSYPFENLVLSGGGSKGNAYIGSLQVCNLCAFKEYGYGKRRQAHIVYFTARRRLAPYILWSCFRLSVRLSVRRRCITTTAKPLGLRTTP